MAIISKTEQSSNGRRKQPPMPAVQRRHRSGREASSAAATRGRRARNHWRLDFVLHSLRVMATTVRWLSLAMVAGCTTGLILLGTNGSYRLSSFPVVGSRFVSAQEIVADSGLVGRHIFAADPVEAAQRIAAVPGVSSAVVTVSWPREVLVEVTETEPVAIWQVGMQRQWVAADAELMPERSTYTGLVYIATEEAEADWLEAMPGGVLEGALQINELRSEITNFNYTIRDGLSFHDSRGWNTSVGVGSDMPQKLAIHEALVAELSADGHVPEYISVSDLERPYFKVVGS